MRSFRRLMVLAVVLGLVLVAPVEAAGLKYPKAKRADTVDEYHGTLVPDPYQWLEENPRNSDAVARWIEDENDVTFAYLEKIQERKAIKDLSTCTDP